MDNRRKTIGNMLAEPGANTKDKRNKEASRRKSGLRQFKLYLGDDASKKLAELYQHQYGHPYVQEGKKYKDTDGIAAVLSYCINYCYAHVFAQQGNGSDVMVPPANSPISHEIYQLHQIASFRYRSMLEIEGRIANLRLMTSFMKNNGYTPLKEVLNQRRFIRKGAAKWELDDIKTLLDVAAVSELIEQYNKQETE